MIYNKKEFFGGTALLVIFFVVLFFMFQPLFGGHNAMQYLDNLYNTISKGSVNYAAQVKTQTDAYSTKNVDLKLNYASEAVALQSVALFEKAGISAVVNGKELQVSGSLGTILAASLVDAQSMYDNDGQTLENKYGLDARRAVYNWWSTLKQIDKTLTTQGEFDAAKMVLTVQTKAVEAAYNYYNVEAVQISDKIGMVIFSLAFYVFYTLWYGFAILFIFEGWGLKLSH